MIPVQRFAGIVAAVACCVLLYGDTIYWAVTSNLGRPSLASARSWCYQLFALDPAALAKADCDVIVMYPLDGAKKAVGETELRLLRRNPNGRRRIVLAYLSVGEAEAYRNYWKAEWLDNPPWWLAGRNPAWRSAYRVRYWAPEWQDQLFRAPQSMVRQIVDAGFDGIYLDTVDVYGVLQSEKPDAEALMARLVIELAGSARALRPNMLIVPQNGEELLAHADYLAAIDGQAKEDLLFGILDDGAPNRRGDITHSLQLLAAVRSRGKPVFVVEYLSDKKQIADAAAQFARRGFIATFAPRLLDRDPASVVRGSGGDGPRGN